MRSVRVRPRRISGPPVVPLVVRRDGPADHLYAHVPYQVAVPVSPRAIIGGEPVAPTVAGFYVARVIDAQERVGYSDPLYVGPDGRIGAAARRR